MDFDGEITSLAELRTVIPAPHELVVAKTQTSLDEMSTRFIEQSPFVLIASSDGRGKHDVSPKGDPPGFVSVLDDCTLAIPDRPGNNRADTLTNLIEHPHVGLLFLVPGARQTLRVNGGARLVTDQALLDSMAVKGRSPKVAIVVDVTEAFFHCTKCVVRSRLWDPEAQAAAARAPSLAEAITAQVDTGLTVEQMDAALADDEVNNLY